MTHLLEISLRCRAVGTRIQSKLMAQERTFVRHCPVIQMRILKASLGPAYSASLDDALAALIAIVEMPAHRLVRDEIQARLLPESARAKI